MPSAGAIAIAAVDMVCEKEQDERLSLNKATGESGEEGAELGEATSNSSLKSPVTPAPANEPNGTPALRWKSYTAKQRVPASGGKYAVAEAADPKGKLVINLCGIPRSLMKLSPAPLKMKSSMVHGIDTSKSEASTSSQGHILRNDDDEDDRVPHGSLEVSAGPENLPEGCPRGLPQHGNEMASHAVNSQEASLARKACLRIKRVRRSVKPTRFQKMDGCNQKESPKMCGVQEEKAPTSGCSALKGFGKKKHRSRRIQEARDVEGDASVRNKIFSEEPRTHAAEEHQETRCTEDSHNPEDEISIQKETIEKSAQHNTSGSTRGTTASVLMRDHSMVQTMSMEQKDDFTLGDASKASAAKVHNNDPTFEDVSGDEKLKEKDDELTSRDRVAKDLTRVKRTAKSLSHDAGALSESSKLDMKEQTVLETLLRDELPGYSSAGGSEPSRSYKAERFVTAEFSQMEDSESGDAESERGDAECSPTDGCEDADTDSSHGCACEGECECNSLSPSTPGTPGRGAYFTEQMPSVLCDAEGNVWHIGKRAEQARGAEECRTSSPLDKVKESHDFSLNSHGDEVQKRAVKRPSTPLVAPFSQEVQLNWKWPSDVDYTINPVVDMLNRSMVAKEKSVFVGCIPDGTENLEEILQNLMEKFLERFDFAPAILSQIQIVKIGKDFAFLELATEKVAHIVLAANQLDVYEWGVNGFHFNIEGCKGTHTSVRPLIEYMPLKPARVIFVGNIPKSCWQKDYLEVFFTRVLRGSDGPADLKLVSSVYLLPESCDAYVELASEIMADAIIFKCTKNPQLLKDIGEDVFICRDASSIPLMSKHKGIVCPQRALFIGVSAPGQEFKVDSVRKIFDEILPVISRETNQPGYLEYISVQPGKDYAFFQFNSEAIVDAVMDEYIENTHLFMCKSSPMSYIILRPPEYVRPGARYHSDIDRRGGPGWANAHMNKLLSKQGRHTGLDMKRRPKSKLSKQPGTISVVPRRFGDEPAKKSDCVMSIGVSPLPMATWNGLSSTGACAADPECMLVFEGLPKGLSYKLLRGALNELFERSLCRTGLLEVGMLVLRYLDRDGNLDVVASLPSAKFVNALLSMRKIFVVAGNEVRLLPKGGRRKINWRGNPAENLGGQGEISCLSDDEANQGRELSRYCGVDEWSAPSSTRRKRGCSETVSHHQAGRGSAFRRKDFEVGTEEWCEQEGLRSFSPPPKRVFRRDLKETSQQWNGAKGSWKVVSRLRTDNHVSKAITFSQWQESSPRGKMPPVRKGAGVLKFGNRGIVQVNEARLKSNKKFPKEVLHIVSEGGKRKIHTVETPFNMGMGVEKGRIVRVANKKRKQLLAGQDGLVQFTQKRFKKWPQFSSVLWPV